ncbi:MAG: hypothetical protein ACR2LV_01070 [Solirubrobacteraceae bacterium]
MLSLQNLRGAAAVTGVLLMAGCGSSSNSSTSSSSSPRPSARGAAPAGPSTASAGALSAEAKATATGDIPDNQVFLVFKNQPAGYSIEYPEGWTQHGAGGDVTFQNNNNLVHITVARGPAPTTASVAAQLQALKGSTPTLTFRAPRVLRLGSAPAVKATYTTQSAPNPVTGKRVTLIVDRYELASGGRRAVVDLGTPSGVDNVDAYRKMIASFRWR